MQSSRKLLVLCSTLMAFAIPSLYVAADDGAKIFDESCSPCHSTSVRPLDNKRMTKEQWKETIEKMIDLGAEVPKKKKSELLDYLASTHGPDAGKK
jgi:cytochrome c5